MIFLQTHNILDRIKVVGLTLFPFTVSTSLTIPISALVAVVAVVAFVSFVTSIPVVPLSFEGPPLESRPPFELEELPELPFEPVSFPPDLPLDELALLELEPFDLSDLP